MDPLTVAVQRPAGRCRHMLDEAARLAALHRLDVLHRPAEIELDEVVTLAARLFDVPSALVTLVDGDHQWVKAAVGTDLAQLPRSITFCDQTIQQSGVLLVEDATDDPRFRDNPLVVGEPHFRFYAGVPLTTSDGAAIGTLCVLDTTARTASPYQQAMLVSLADQVIGYFEHRSGSSADDLPGPVAAAPGDATAAAHFRHFVAEGSTGYVETTDQGLIVAINPAAMRMLGYTDEELIGRPARLLAHPDHRPDVDAAFESLRSGARSTYEATRVYQHKSGRPVPARCTVSFLPATLDSPASIAGLVVDLTPRISADSHRLAAERDRDRVLAAATDAYIALDRSGVVCEWNAAAERTFGYRAEEALGQVLALLIVPEDLRDAHAAGLRRLAAGGTPTILGRSTEVTALHRDGHLIQVELTPWRVRGEFGADGYYAFCRDIGERVSARAALLEANERLRQGQAQMRAAFEASSTADALVDDTGSLLHVNPRMCSFLGRTREQLVHHRITEFVLEHDLAEAESAVTRGGPALPDRTELRFVTGDGRVTWGLASLSPTGIAAGDVSAVLRIESLQAFKDLESALARQSTHDALTGLPNRGLFLERVRQALVHLEPGALVACLVLRVGGLRDLVVAGGFAAGDEAVAALAGRLDEATPHDVTLAHLRPGLFAAVIPGGTIDAARLANRYVAAVGAPSDGVASTTPLRASIGIGTATSEAGSEDARTGQLVQEAETAARLASEEGGSTVVFAAPAMREAQQRQQQLESLVRHALEHHRVGVAYQPVFDLSSGRVVGAEALLRLSDAQGHPVSPLDVVSAAETSGQIVELGRRVLQMAADQAAEWRRDHGLLIPVAVNVSAVQLRRPSFTADVLDVLERADVPAAALTLELTESVLLTSGSAGMEQLVVLRDSGVHLAIDDFGTGYASLTYLRDLPATTLKVDRSFVEGIPDDRGAMAIVRGVIDLATSFGMSCIAEGIENEAQRAYLAGRGVLGQGYLLARPTDAASVGRLIAEHGAQPSPGGAPVSAADARDHAGLRRDTAGHARDEAGDERDHVGDLRDRVSDQRDLLADRRDAAGDRRDHAADERDDLAEQRDRAGTLRDQAAGQRDLDEAILGASGLPGLEARTRSLALVRRAARSDRERALLDREAGATERALAGHDRTSALADRGAGARERVQAEQDRSTSSDDRDLGAGERARSEDDRSTAQADRGASARDRGEALVDPLTGAHVRGAGLLELEREIARATRTGVQLVVAFVDIDGLKAVNDTAGHAAGDAVIRDVGHALSSNLRSYDLLVRYGGGEFLCAVSGLSVLDTGARLAAATAVLDTLPSAPSVSVGLAELRAGDTVESLVGRADADLCAKRRSRA